jgi:hypothetical protein
MPKPMAVCVEDLSGGADKPKFMQCVALGGRQPGLTLDETGKVAWQASSGVSCELWVSADNKLILYRPGGARAVVLHRAGRSLDVPCDKPVVVVDRDEVEVGPQRLRIHVHGAARVVAAPSAYDPDVRSRGAIGKAAAAALLGGALVASGCQDVEVRDTPPSVIEVRDQPPVAEPVDEVTPDDSSSGTDSPEGDGT